MERRDHCVEQFCQISSDRPFISPVEMDPGQETLTHLPPTPDSSIRQRADRLVEDWFPDVLKSPQAIALQLWNDALIQRRALQEAITRFCQVRSVKVNSKKFGVGTCDYATQRRQVIVGERVEEDDTLKVG